MCSSKTKSTFRSKFPLTKADSQSLMESLGIIMTWLLAWYDCLSWHGDALTSRPSTPEKGLESWHLEQMGRTNFVFPRLSLQPHLNSNETPKLPNLTFLRIRANTSFCLSTGILAGLTQDASLPVMMCAGGFVVSLFYFQKFWLSFLLEIFITVRRFRFKI